MLDCLLIRWCKIKQFLVTVFQIKQITFSFIFISFKNKVKGLLLAPAGGSDSAGLYSNLFSYPSGANLTLTLYDLFLAPTGGSNPAEPYPNPFPNPSWQTYPNIE